MIVDAEASLCIVFGGVCRFPENETYDGPPRVSLWDIHLQQSFTKPLRR